MDGWVLLAVSSWNVLQHGRTHLHLNMWAFSLGTTWRCKRRVWTSVCASSKRAPYRTSVLDTKAMSFPSQSSWQYHLWLFWLNSPTFAPCQCVREILCRKAAKSVVDMQVPRSEDVWHFARMETLALCSLQWFMYVAVCMFMFCCLLLLGGGVVWIR